MSKSTDFTDSILDGLSELFAKALEETTKIDAERAKKIANSVISEFASQNGGVSIYIPRRKQTIRDVRNSEIFEKFNGTNFRELAMEYGLSDMRVRQILAEKKRGKFS